MVPLEILVERHLAPLADTLEELRRQTHRIDSPSRDLDLSRIGTMREGTDEQPVSPWRKSVKHRHRHHIIMGWRYGKRSPRAMPEQERLV